MRVDPSGPRGASSGDVPPPPSSTGVDAAETSGDAADVPLPTTWMIQTFDVHWIMS